MKNKNFFFKIFFIIFSIFYSHSALSDEFMFSANEVESLDGGNLIKGYGGVEINDSLNLTISGDQFEFNKIDSLLKVTNNVLVNDKLNKSLIKTSQISYNKELNIITSLGKTIIELNSGHIIESLDVIFDKNLNILFSNDKTFITGPNKNKFSMGTFKFSITTKILTTEDIEIKDNKGNKHNVKNIKYNLKTNEILGKDLSINYNNSNSASNKNEPRLKGNSFFYKKDVTEINKGVFTTCKKTDKCPPWVMSAEKIEHDKIKKVINYKNAVLKIYDIPVLYFPKFFHPDPTVKRQSGFLIPSFSQSSNLGNYISIPYFNAISEDSDLTFSPRFYDDGKSVYQSEYRKYTENSEHELDFSIKNKSTLVFDEDNNSSDTHFFLKSKLDLDLNNFDKAQINLKIQQTSNDDYLKTYKLKSPQIESENNLHSSLNFNMSREDLQVQISAETYENLDLITSDRYEYVYPSFNILKSIDYFENGDLTLDSTGINKQFDTNIHEKTFINDLNYKSYNKISALGLLSNYEILIKNFNSQSKNSVTYKNKTENSLQSIINYEMKYPLKKNRPNFSSMLTPIISTRYSPNKSKNKSQSDVAVDFNNIFSINRISSDDTVESGQSITIGSEYSLYDNKNNNEILSIDLATAIRDVKNDKLPITSTLGKKNSDIVGNINFNTNKFIDINYGFSLDNDLKTLNVNQIKSTLSFYNFVSTFDFLEKNNLLGSESYMSNETKLIVNENSSFSYKTRINKEKDLTEYYNLIYEYKNDCLAAGIEFKKDYYSDGSLKPEEQLFFSITIMPFGKVGTPNIKQ